jgi:FkbM family methyltransferase
MVNSISELRWLLGCVLSHPNNRRHRFRALVRFASWQIRKRILKRPAVVRVGATRRFKVVCDSPFSSTVVYNVLPDWDEMNFLLRFLRPTDGFIDIGANVGFYTVLASTIITEGPLLAFEANPRNVEVLRQQVELNQLRNAEVFCSALGDSTGDLSFHDSGRETGSIHSANDRTVKSITVPCHRLDDCLSNRALPRCVVAKMDVEGFETTVLGGASATIEKGRVSVWLFELNAIALRDHGSSEEQLLAAYSEHGYSIIYWDEERQRLGRRGDEHDGDRANYLACRDIGTIERRIAEGSRTAPRP